MLVGRKDCPDAAEWLPLSTRELGGPATTAPSINVFEELTYRPENARGGCSKDADWHPPAGPEIVEGLPNNNQFSADLPPPPCFSIYVQGNPGTGKQNMVRVVLASSQRDQTSTTTWFTAAL